MNFSKLTLIEIRDLIASGKVSSEEVVTFFAEKSAQNSNLNAIVEVFDDAVENARKIDEK